jgi:hypothetical protein
MCYRLFLEGSAGHLVDVIAGQDQWLLDNHSGHHRVDKDRGRHLLEPFR